MKINQKNMKAIKYLLLVFLLSPAVLLAQTGPVIQFNNGENIQTGSHQRGKEVNYDILFKNAGDSDLKIISVTPTCGCSSALTSDSVIKPGESGSIKFTFNGNGFGPVTKNLIVNTNESANNYHELHMTMNMVDPVVLSPQSIIMDGKVGDEIKKDASMLNSLDKEISITDVSSNSPVVKVTSDKMTLGPGEAAALSINIKVYEESAINAAVIIKTSEGEFQIPILVDVKAK
jgi:hypothetical protein